MPEPAAAIGVETGRFEGWGACHLRNGDLKLVLVPQVGGRVMAVRWRDQELYLVNPELLGRVEPVMQACDPCARKRELGFLHWGGDKTWLAPQSHWSDRLPFFDLDSGSYRLELRKNDPDLVRVEMTSRVCRESGIEVSRSVELATSQAGWSVTHRLTNRSGRPVAWGPWSVSMVLRPGRVYLPRSAASPYPGGVKAFENEGRSTDSHDEVLEELGSLAVIRCDAPTAFKYGVDPSDGWMLGVVETRQGLVGYGKTVRPYLDRPYAHGCISEVYNSARYPYFEMEIHGPVTSLDPGGHVAVREAHVVCDVASWPASEAAVRQLVVGGVERFAGDA